MASLTSTLLLAVALPALAGVEATPREFSWRAPGDTAALWRAAARLGLVAPEETPPAATDHAAWQAFNQARAAARERGEVVFGPREFTHADYRAYVAAQMAARVRQALAAARPELFTDAALRTRYERDLARFARRDRLELVILEAGVPAGEEAGLRATFAAVRESWARQSEPPAGLWILTREIADDYAQRRSEIHRAALYTSITPDIQAGDFSPVIIADGVIMLARLVGRTPGGFVPFADARAHLRARVLDGLFRESLDESAAAKLESHDAVAAPAPAGP
jgi:hypothetical protein